MKHKPIGKTSHLPVWSTINSSHFLPVKQHYGPTYVNIAHFFAKFSI